MDLLEQAKSILNDLPDGNMGSYCDDLMELTLSGGIGYSLGLFKNEKVAVAKTKVSKGSIFAPHYHKETEILILFEGQLKIWKGIAKMEDRDDIEPIILDMAQTMIIEPNTPHLAEALADTQLIAVTVPASKRFPNAKKR